MSPYLVGFLVDIAVSKYCCTQVCVPARNFDGGANLAVLDVAEAPHVTRSSIANVVSVA